MILLFLASAVSAGAQTYEDARRAFDLSPDPLARSPRLVGMGRLSLALDDPNHHITLWDFAGNPTGILDDDTSSTAALRPGSHSLSSEHTQFEPGTSFRRQDLAMHETGVGYEFWHRNPNTTAFGAVGELATLSSDRPFASNIEQRSRFSVPTGVAVVNGAMPYIASDRMRYAVRLLSSYQSETERYRAFVRNGAGEFINQQGDLGGPPEFFTPDDIKTRTLGGGVAASYRFGAPLTLAAGVDRVGNEINGDNVGGRYSSERHEKRPYTIGQATMVGRIGKSLEWGVDGHSYTSTSDARWVFTISAGVGGNPLDGRGKLYHRKESGSDVRGRIHWSSGPFEFGAGGSAETRKIEIFATNVNDPESFNHFRNLIVHRAGADSIVLPDSIVDSATKETGWEAGGGVAVHLPWRHALAAAEYHLSRSLFNQLLGGDGPKGREWNARAGLEVPVTSVLTARGGYIHRWHDRDIFTAQNEYLGDAMTLGLGIKPAARWIIEGGYVLEWTRADFGDPQEPKGSRQQIAISIDWSF